MARTKASVTEKEEEKKKKEKRSDDTKKNKNDNDKSKRDSSDSEDEMFTKIEKEEAGIPTFIKGTTWPVDTSVEIMVNYDAAKEIRTVRKEFYPLLFHMTRTDPRQMSNCICKSKVLLSFIKARIEHRSKDKTIRNKYGLLQEMKSLKVAAPAESPKKTRSTVSSAAAAVSISDITDAKTEILKLLARVSLKRQEFAKLLVWVQKLKLCGVQGGGRWGEVYVKDTTADSLDSSATESEDSDNGEKKQKCSKRGRPFGSLGRGRSYGSLGRGRGRGGRGKARNWRVALRPKITKPRQESPEPEPKKARSKSPGDSSQGSETNSYYTRKLKFPTWELKGKTIFKRDNEEKVKKCSPEKSPDKCFIPLVDVVSVLDKRIMDKNKQQDNKSHTGRGRGKKRFSAENQKYSTEKEKSEEEFVPNKKYRLASEKSESADPEVPVPVCLYRADENENISAPFVEIDNVENGVCVPYEERFVTKEIEVEQKILAILKNHKHETSLSTENLTKMKNKYMTVIPETSSNTTYPDSGIRSQMHGKMGPLFPASQIPHVETSIIQSSNEPPCTVTYSSLTSTVMPPTTQQVLHSHIPDITRSRNQRFIPPYTQSVMPPTTQHVLQPKARYSNQNFMPPYTCTQAVMPHNTQHVLQPNIPDRASSSNQGFIAPITQAVMPPSTPDIIQTNVPGIATSNNQNFIPPNTQTVLPSTTQAVMPPKTQSAVPPTTQSIVSLGSQIRTVSETRIGPFTQGLARFLSRQSKSVTADDGNIPIVVSDDQITQSQPQFTPSQGAAQDLLKVKTEQQIGLLSNMPSGIVSISDGATMSCSTQAAGSLGNHEPTSSTSGTENDITSVDNVTVKQEQVLDYVVVKNEEYISLDSSDDEETNSTLKNENRTGPPKSNQSSSASSSINDHKEADPIIVIDD